jgi:hypothetical protein
MAYEPEQRYLQDPSTRREVNAPFDEQPATDSGQFWTVTNHVRSRWARAGGAAGLTFAALYFLLDGDIPQICASHLVSTLAFLGACILCGSAVGFAAASVRHRFTGDV